MTLLTLLISCFQVRIGKLTYIGHADDGQMLCGCREGYRGAVVGDLLRLTEGFSTDHSFSATPKIFHKFVSF